MKILTRVACLSFMFCFFLAASPAVHAATKAKKTSKRTAYSADRTFKFLEESFKRHDKKMHDFLIAELEHYLELFPKSKHARRVQYMLGSIYEKDGKKDLAVASYLKMLFLYPSAAGIAESTDSLHELISTQKSYEKKRNWLRKQIKKVSIKSYSDEGYFKYLDVMIRLDQPKLRDWTLDSCRAFIISFPSSRKNEQVLVWIADIYDQEKKFSEAEASYRKFVTVYPNSPLLPAIRYKQGVLLYENLKKDKDAVEVMATLVKKYPNSKYAVKALLLSGEIKEKKLKDYKAAIADYRRLADKYPKDENAVEALWTIAKINQVKLKDYKTANYFYSEIVNRYPKNEKGVKALEEMAKIYKGQLKDYDAAASTYARIARLYPDYEKAVQRLLDAGTICESKLKDYRRAISYYQIILEKFGSHKKAETARKRIQSASKKMAKK